MRRFGLIGKDISYSFSPGYFREKFDRLGIEDCTYEIFDLSSLDQFPQLLQDKPDLVGLNVTIPYKEAILPFLDHLDMVATGIGAVNTIRIGKEGLVGYNTDAIGFEHSLVPLLGENDRQALILGTGGGSKAIAYTLEKIGISFRRVSRNPAKGQLAYTDLDPQLLGEVQLIINCTPLGTFPKVDALPPIPYEGLTSSHLLYDLIYNPEQTAFLRKGKEMGGRTKNGLEMLQLQAEASWEIWMQAR